MYSDSHYSLPWSVGDVLSSHIGEGHCRVTVG
jgi:hypothetical protein